MTIAKVVYLCAGVLVLTTVSVFRCSVRVGLLLGRRLMIVFTSRSLVLLLMGYRVVTVSEALVLNVVGTSLSGLLLGLTWHSLLP